MYFCTRRICGTVQPGTFEDFNTDKINQSFSAQHKHEHQTLTQTWDNRTLKSISFNDWVFLHAHCRKHWLARPLGRGQF